LRALLDAFVRSRSPFRGGLSGSPRENELACLAEEHTTGFRELEQRFEGLFDRLAERQARAWRLESVKPWAARRLRRIHARSARACLAACRTATRATHVDAASSDSTSGRHDARGEAGRREAGRGGRPAPRVVVRDATGAILAAVSAWPGMMVKQETGAATTKRVDRDARHAGMGSSRPGLRREQTTADARPHLDGRELMGMHGTRRAWTRPALVAIVRRTPQEDVLTSCKYYNWAGRPQNAALSCTVVTCVASCDALAGS
jgi:hypothetical protein